MILNIRFPFMIVKTDYLKEQTRETEARLEATIKSLSEKIKATEKLYEKMQREKDSIRRDIEHWRVQFSDYAKQPCLECGEDIVVQPFGDESYYLEHGGVVHPKCSDKYRKRSDWKPRDIHESIFNIKRKD